MVGRGKKTSPHLFDCRPMSAASMKAALANLKGQRNLGVKRPPTSPEVGASPTKKPAAPANSRSDGSPTPSSASDIPDAVINEDKRHSPTKKPVGASKIPPFFIDGGVSDWPKLAEKIQRLDPGAECLFRGTNYRCKASSVEGFRAIQRCFIAGGVQFHTFGFKGSGPLKVVISGLPDHLVEDDLNDMLSEFQVDNVERLRNRRGLTKSWLIHLLPDDHDSLEEGWRPRASIYKITRLYGVKVAIAPFKRPPGPPQCHRCQRFGHGSSLCYMPLRCVRCGEAHERHQCLKPKEETGTCTNCGEAHNASYKGCKAYKAAKKLQRPKAQKWVAEPVRPPPAPTPRTTLGDQPADMEVDTDGFQPVRYRKRKKRPARNPENRHPQPRAKEPRDQPEPPAPPHRPDPTPRPRAQRSAAPTHQPASPAGGQEPAAAPQQPATAPASSQPELRDVMALLTEVLAQLTSLTGLLSSLLPQPQKD